jgi:predicted Ser/Thr protein kinase
MEIMSDATRIGTVVAGYRVESLLGRGGMSVVYLAEHVRLGRKVALKVLSPALSHDERFRERFMRESQRAAEIDHPNVVSIYDAGEVDEGDAHGLLYIAMRYVEGCDLKALVKRDGALSVGRTLFILEQAAAGLDAAHEHNLIHRDVKPGNILVSEPSDHVFLTDFGVVKHTGSRGLTETGLFVGTIDYAAPEQIEGLPLDSRTDVYALGCVLYECLTGKRPYDREAEVAVMHAHLVEDPPRVTDEKPDLPRGLDRVLAKAMAKSKEERFATCPEVIEAARAVVLARRPTGDVPVVVAPPAGDDSQPAVADAPVAEPPPAPATIKAAAPVAPASEAGVQTEPEPATGSPAAANSTVLAQPPAAPPPLIQAPGEPPAEPPQQPPAAPPGGTHPPGEPRRGRSPWVVPALAALAAAVVSGLAVFLLTMNDSSSDTVETVPPTGSTATGTTTAPSGLLTLQDVVEPALFKDCVVQKTPKAGATETAVCTPSQTVSNSTAPDSWEVSTYPNAAALAAAYEAERVAHHVTKSGGRCDGSSWGGNAAWSHNPTSAGAIRKPGGHRLCYFDGNDAVIVWTHEKFGQPNHVDTLAIARKGNLDHPGLFTWWRFWHHRAIGRTAA